MKLISLIRAALWVLALPVAAYAAAESGPEIGKPAPNLMGRTLQDKIYRLKSDNEKPKVINFFWVECKPCRQEMPELAEMEKKYKGVKFISVHTKQETPENVTKFIKSLAGAPSTIVLTTGGMQETFHYAGLPHTMVLDRNNTVLMNISGYTPDNMKLLAKALGKL